MSHQAHRQRRNAPLKKLGKAQALPGTADAAHKTLVFKRFIEDWYYYVRVLRVVVGIKPPKKCSAFDTTKIPQVFRKVKFWPGL